MPEPKEMTIADLMQDLRDNPGLRVSAQLRIRDGAVSIHMSGKNAASIAAVRPTFDEAYEAAFKTYKATQGPEVLKRRP